MEFRNRSFIFTLSFLLLTIVCSLASVKQLVFQDGFGGYSGTEDTSIQRPWDNPNWENANFGKSEELTCYGRGQVGDLRMSLIRFTDIVGDGPSQIPRGAIVTSAYLEMFVGDHGWDATGTKVRAYKMLTPWVEGSANGASETGSSTLKYRYYPSTYWGDGTEETRYGPVRGVDYKDDSLVLADWQKVPGFKVTFDITSYVNDWVREPETNYGMILMSNTWDSGPYFRSSEYNADPTLRPRLVVEYQLRAGTPQITPGEGKYCESVLVEISSETEGASIYYTTDGSEPTDESTLYTGPFLLTESCTVKAIAYHDEFFPSLISEANYLILTKASEPIIRTEGGVYYNSVEVVIEGMEDAIIHYTLDGSDPTESSPIYREPLELTQTTILKAIQLAENYYESDVVCETFEIKYKLDSQRENTIKYVTDLGSMTLYTPADAVINDEVLEIEPFTTSLGLGYSIPKLELSKPAIIVMDYGHILDSINDENNLAIYCLYDGAEIPLGGTVDVSRKIVKAETTILGDFFLVEYSREDQESLLCEVAFSTNPFRTKNGENAVLRFYLNKPAEVVFQIWDSRGNKKMHEEKRSFGPGLNSFIWDGSSNGRQLPSGLYVFNISAKAFDNEKAQFTGLISIVN